MSAITKAGQNGSRNVVLNLDSPDVLLALTLASTQQLNNWLLNLRNLAHSTMLVCSADLPLLSAASSASETVPTPIEEEGAAFMVQQAHNARFVMSVRELETGAARDVSGVLRVTRGGAAGSADDEGEQGSVDEVRELEALYLVQRDGNAKVFERGAAGHG